MLKCFGFTSQHQSDEPKLVSIIVVNQLPELVLVKKTNTFKYCPVCMEDDCKQPTNFKCSLCKQRICEDCVKSIILINGSASMCPLCRGKPICRKSENEILRSSNNELVRTLVRDASIKCF